MEKKILWLGILVMTLVFGMMVVGCDDGSRDTKTVDSKFHGKWEFESLVISGITYTLPGTIHGVYFSSGGYIINATKVIIYNNGSIVASLNAYSEGNTLFTTTGLAMGTMQITGNNATLTNHLGDRDNLVKVTRFSRE